MTVQILHCNHGSKHCRVQKDEAKARMTVQLLHLANLTQLGHSVYFQALSLVERHLGNVARLDEIKLSSMSSLILHAMVGCRTSISENFRL